MNQTKLSVTLLFSLLISGCAIGPTFKTPPIPEKSQAKVVVYRSMTFAGGGWPVSFHIDGKRFVWLYGKGYSYVTVPPGEHALHHTGRKMNPDNTVKFKIDGGQTYYFRYSTSVMNVIPVGGLVYHQGHLILTSIDVAPDEITGFKYNEPNSDFYEK